MENAKPTKGKGQKNVNCTLYEGCLDFADLKNWKAFNCESCGSFRAGQVKNQKEPETENVKLCEDCGQKPTLHPNSTLCASCMAKRSHGQRKTKQKATEKPKPANKGNHKHFPTKAPETANTAITIEFGKHGSILKEVEKLADEEMRPLDLQILYILKNYLDNIERR